MEERRTSGHHVSAYENFRNLAVSNALTSNAVAHCFILDPWL